MKSLNRRQLRRLISEAIYNISENVEANNMKNPAVTCMKPTSENPNAAMVFLKDVPGVIDALSASSSYKNKRYYVLCTDDNKLAGTKFAMLGTHGKPGDPYTYNHLGGKKYQVISGPSAKAIGKKITIEKGREEHDEDTIAALMKSSSAKSSASSSKSSGSLKRS